MKQTKSQIKAEKFLHHGFNLKRLFDLPSRLGEIGPAQLYKEIKAIENLAHRYAEQECNGETDLTEEQSDARDKRILDRLDKLTGFREKGIPVFINSDPRGYALKIESEYIAENNIDIYRDLGGYGILAPDFD